MALPATDNFNRADENPIAGNWTVVDSTNALKILSNALHHAGSAGSGHSAYRWNADTPNADQYAQIAAVSPALSVYIGVGVRMSSSADTLYELHADSGTYFLNRRNAGVNTQLATGSVTVANGDVLRLEVSGVGATVSLVMKKNGTQFGSTYSDTDANRITAAGYLGVSFYNGSNIIGGDDWQGGNLASAVSKPYYYGLSQGLR